ncbi:MAG: ATP-binding protein, partial [Actinomycetota bacterium]|nr:ATP-binding protein [Actinomycetota bacterium]
LDNDGVCLSVKVIDDGIGLPPDFQIDDGTGLGLSIVRSLVTSQVGGSIDLRSGEVSGTIVELRLPVGLAPATGR